MGQVGKYLRRTGADTGNTAGGYAHYCPGCKRMHVFAVDAPFSNGARWTFNGDLEKPTFTPSMNITGQGVCHYFLRDGQIQFLVDCTHGLSGQTVPLPELPPEYRDAAP
jgi:hypothetical protein